MKKMYVCLLLFCISTTCVAEYSNWATPTRISLVLDKGLSVQGEFANPGACESSDIVFIDRDHPQYEQIYSMVLASFASGNEIGFEVRKCVTIGWISNKSIGVLDATSPGEIRNQK